MARLQNKVAFISGGSTGVGRAVVERFVAEGAAVVVLDRVAGNLGSDVALVEGDVRDPDAHAAAVQRAIDEHGRLDVLVANAGVHDGGRRIDELSGAALVALMSEIFDINVIGYALALQAASPHLRRSRGTAILTLSDVCSHALGVGSGVAYASSKHAALGLMKAAAAELAPDVRVNAVAPGGVVTNLRVADGSADGAGGDLLFDPDAPWDERIRSMNPLQVAVTTEQLAEAYLFLAGEGSVGMTGEILRVDGGLGLR